jgi:hypothetical protein
VNNINQYRWRILGGEKLKKIWAIALSALLVFGIAAFTGCAEKEPVEEEPIEPIGPVEEEEPWWPITEEEEEPWPEEEPEAEKEGGRFAGIADKCSTLPLIGGLCEGCCSMCPF